MDYYQWIQNIQTLRILNHGLSSMDFQCVQRSPTGRVPGKYHSWNRWGRVGESGATKFVSFPGAKFVAFPFGSGWRFEIKGTRECWWWILLYIIICYYMLCWFILDDDGYWWWILILMIDIDDDDDDDDHLHSILPWHRKLSSTSRGLQLRNRPSRSGRSVGHSGTSH